MHTELATIRDEIKALERAAIMVKRVAGTNLAGALVMGLQTFVG